MVTVGTRKVEVVKYLAEGGFAQIYEVKFVENLNEFENKNNSNIALNIGDSACLKRVLVPDENGLNEMRNEVEVMEKLQNCPNIVQYFDSNASRRKDGGQGFEVLLLMELCPNKSLLDYMNQRLTTKLSEKEILTIMLDLTLAVSHMHYLSPPLIHRDIKIENVLVDSSNGFKLADFGSTSTCSPSVSTHQEIAILTHNIYMNTTPQYRCPEMIDLYKCLPIDEKSDIWALGVFLYKLLFFTTPFEMTGQFAILHSKYEFPPNSYSSKLINLVIIMLSENPNLRPNIYQVLHYLCSISNNRLEITDKYNQGPYKFNQYTKFQTNVQNLQSQMYQLQLKKSENNGNLDTNDEALLNHIYTSAFEVSPNIPLDVGNNNHYLSPTSIENLRSPSDDGIEKRKSLASEVRLSRHASHSADSGKLINASGSSDDGVPMEKTGSMERITSIEQQQYISSQMRKSLSAQNVDQNIDIENDITDMYLSLSLNNKREKSIGSIPSNSGQHANAGPLPHSEMVSEEFLSTDPNAVSDSAGTTKQHKSNNPFPQMINTYQATSQQQQQQQQQQNSNVFINDNSQVSNQRAVGNIQYQNAENRNAANIVSPRAYNGQMLQQTQQRRPQTYNQPIFYEAKEYPQTNPQRTFQQQFQQTQQNQLSTTGIIPGPVDPNMNFNYGIPVSPFYQNSKSNAPIQTSTTSPDTSGEKPPPPPLPPHPRTENGHVASKIHQSKEKQRRELPNLPNSSSPEKEEKLIDISPLRVNNKTLFDKKTSIQALETHFNPERHCGNLDLTFNELDLSQDDSQVNTPATELPNADEQENSILSSESIDINLHDAKVRKQKSMYSEADSKVANSQTKRNVSKSLSQVTSDGTKINIKRHSKASGSASQRYSDERVLINSEPKGERRSLDLKYQEVHFSSPNLGSQAKSAGSSYKSSSKSKAKDEGQQSYTHSHSHSNKQGRSYNYSHPANGKIGTDTGLVKSTTRANHDLENYENSSGSGNESNTSLSDGVRNSFSRARQSLDLERLRRDTSKTTDTSKRRSFFSSVFRGEKK